jgi:hypothetical protein
MISRICVYVSDEGKGDKGGGRCVYVSDGVRGNRKGRREGLI